MNRTPVLLSLLLLSGAAGAAERVRPALQTYQPRLIYGGQPQMDLRDGATTRPTPATAHRDAAPAPEKTPARREGADRPSRRRG